MGTPSFHGAQETPRGFCPLRQSNIMVDRRQRSGVLLHDFPFDSIEQLYIIHVMPDFITFSYMYIMYFDHTYLPHYAIFPSPFLLIFLFLVRPTSVFMSLSFLHVCMCACAYMYAYVHACVCIFMGLSRVSYRSVGRGLITRVWAPYQESPSSSNYRSLQRIRASWASMTGCGWA